MKSFTFSCFLLFLLLSTRAQVPGTNIYFTPENSFVGIGVSSPLTQLHVNGSISATAYFKGFASGITGFTQLWEDNAIMWKFGDLNNDGVGGLRFGSATDLAATNWSEKMRITDAGNIGIGVKTPVFTVDIASPDNDQAVSRLRFANTISQGNNAPGSYPAIEVLGARGDGNTTFEGRLALGTRRTDGLTLVNQTLGAVLFGGQYGTDNNFQANKMLYPASIQGVAEGNFTSGTVMPTGIVFMTGAAGNDVGTGNLSYGTERMRIFNNGNVGIGTSTPGSNKLAVEGTVGARKVIVTQAVWSDYVFDRNYHLASLDSVKNYIQLNHHLPDVPSAESVARNGLDLGGNQAQLLKKIEELTLYVIDLDKKNEALQKEVQALKDIVHPVKGTKP